MCAFLKSLTMQIQTDQSTRDQSSFDTSQLSRKRTPHYLNPSSPDQRTKRNLSLQRRQGESQMNNESEYLQTLSTGINFKQEMTLLRSFSNKYMSVLIISLESPSLRDIYEDNTHLLRCYNNRKKIFEMPLSCFPLFIDVFDSTIAYILESDMAQKMFQVIDIGQKIDEERGIDKEIEGMKAPISFEHEFDEDIIGMKLGTFLDPGNGNKKLVIWSEEKAYMYPFNTDKNEMMNNKSLKANQDEIEFDRSIDIKRILDFGFNPNLVVDQVYEEAIPEVFLIQDTDDNIQILSGETYGKSFSMKLSYPSFEEEHFQLEKIHQMALVQTTKIIAIIDKKIDQCPNIETYIQIFEFDVNENYLKPVRHFPIELHQVGNAIAKIKTFQLIDCLNDCVIIKEFIEGHKYLEMIPISNSISGKAERLAGSFQIGLNLVANNVDLAPVGKKTVKTKGLLIDDFCCSNNLIVVLHGKVISCFDLMNTKKDPQHITFSMHLNGNKRRVKPKVIEERKVELSVGQKQVEIVVEEEEEEEEEIDNRAKKLVKQSQRRNSEEEEEEEEQEIDTKQKNKQKQRRRNSEEEEEEEEENDSRKKNKQSKKRKFSEEEEEEQDSESSFKRNKSKKKKKRNSEDEEEEEVEEQSDSSVKNKKNLKKRKMSCDEEEEEESDSSFKRNKNKKKRKRNSEDEEEEEKEESDSSFRRNKKLPKKKRSSEDEEEEEVESDSSSVKMNKRKSQKKRFSEDEEEDEEEEVKPQQRNRNEPEEEKNEVILVHSIEVAVSPIVEDTFSDDYYNFDDEPYAIWMMDKETKDTSKRWKIVVAFKNGEVKELEYQTLGETNQIILKPLLVDKNGTPQKLKGQITKIFRNKNAINQPVYFLLKDPDTGKEVFSTIEFDSCTLRQFHIPGLVPVIGQDENNESLHTIRYVIMEIKDSERMYQDVACFVTYQDEQKEILEQKMVYVKLRIGQYELNNKEREIQVIRTEEIPASMKSIKKASNLFVCDETIYFIHMGHVESYNVTENVCVKISTNENIVKLICLNKKFFYWRTQLGGINYNRYRSRIYFDRLDNEKSLSQQCANGDVMLYDGVYPHINKLQYDSASDYLAMFTDFFELRVFPLLHQNRLKIQVEGKRHSDHHILASKLIIQQRITDELTLVRSKGPCFEDTEVAKGSFIPIYDYTSEIENIKMHYYKIIKISLKGNKLDEENFNIEVINQFVGPHIEDDPRFGLFSNDAGSRYAFFFKDTQEKLQINYYKTAIIKPFEHLDQIYDYLQPLYKAEPKNALLSIHSPDYKYIITSDEKNNYYIRKPDPSEPEPAVIIPSYLGKYSVQHPSFFSNTSVLFLTEDKILKCHNINEGHIDVIAQESKKSALMIHNYYGPETDEGSKEVPTEETSNSHISREQFSITNCSFPGSDVAINLSTVHCIGDETNRHIIGENCLVYEQQFDSNNQVDEFIVPNSFNYFYQEAAKEFKGIEDYREIKFIQCRYKSKIEMKKGSNFGYFFSSNEQHETGKVSTSMFIISTFSYYHWRLISLIKDKKINIQEVPVEIIKELLYIQLPNQNTLLHLLVKNTSALQYLLGQIMEENENIEKENPMFFQVPLLKNRLNYTPLDRALNILNKKQTTTLKTMENLMQKKMSEASEVDFFNRKAAELLLKSVSFYPFNLFKINIKDSIPSILKQNLMEFSTLMDCCLKSPSFLKDFERGNISSDNYFGALVFDADDVWSQQTKQEVDNLFKVEQAKGAEERLINVKVLDIPYANLLDEDEGEKKKDNIFRELAKTKNDDIFQKTAIKALIESRWPPIRKGIIYWLLCPYLVFILLFTFFTMLDLESNQTIDAYVHVGAIYVIPAQIFCRLGIILFAIYFLGIELWQIRGDKEKLRLYVTNYWRYLDIIPAIFILLAELINISSDSELSDRLIRILYSFTALLLWLRFLYFVRIFRSMGFYIYMITEVIKDMKEFLFIFVITIIAFGQSLFIFFQNNKDEHQFITGFDALIYMYRVAISDIDSNNFKDDNPTIAWSIFILATFFVLIVLLNMLISIVADTFERVNQVSANMMYKDMVGLIVENQYLVKSGSKDFDIIKAPKPKKYIMVAIPDDYDIQNKGTENFMRSIFETLQEMNQSIKKIEKNQRQIIQKKK